MGPVPRPPAAGPGRIPGPIPVHLPAHHRICLRHGIWLPAAGLPQLDISRCPDILEAEKRARHAARQHSPEQMILAETQTQQAIAGPVPQPSRLRDAAQRAWQQRVQTVIEANHRDAIEANPHALFQAAGHPDASRPGFADDVIRMCRSAGFSPVIAVEANNVVACLAYVAIGEAMAVVPSSATRTRPHGVTFVPLGDAPPATLECISLAANAAPALALFTRFLDHRCDALKAEMVLRTVRNGIGHQ